MRTIPTIGYAEAKRVVDHIVEEASQIEKAVVVAVADSRGELICFARMDGASVSSITIAMNKAWTAARAGKPTQEIGEKVRHPEKGMISLTTVIRDSLAGAVGSRSGITARSWAPLPSVDSLQ